MNDNEEIEIENNPAPAAPAPDPVAALNQEVASLKASLATMTSARDLAEAETVRLKAPPAPVPSKVDDIATRMLLDPQSVLNENNSLVVDRAVERIRSEQVQESVLADVRTAYPKLSDASNPFTIKVAKEYSDRLSRLGYASGKHDSLVLRDAAQLVERQELIDRMNDGAGVASGSAPRSEGGARGSVPGSSFRLSEDQSAIASALGLTPEQATAAYSAKREFANA